VQRLILKDLNFVSAPKILNFVSAPKILKEIIETIEVMFCFGTPLLKMVLNESQLFGLSSFIKLHVSTVR